MPYVLMMAVCLSAEPRPEPKSIEGDPKTGQALAIVSEWGYLAYTGQIFPTGPSVAPTPPEEQIADVFRQLDRLVTPKGVLKLNVYVHEPSIAALITKQLAKRYSGGYQPAVCFVQTAMPSGGVVVGLDAVVEVGAPPSEGMVRREKPSVKGRPSPLAFLPSGGTAYISGQAEKGDGTVADATKKTMESLFKTLTFLECRPADVVQIKAFLTPMKDSTIAIKEIVAAFGDEVAPPVSVVEWKSTLPIEIEMVVSSRSRPEAPRIEYLTPPEMKASPVYARVTRINTPGQIFVGGLLGKTEMPSSADEVRDVFATLKRVTEAAGSDLKHLAKATYYVSDEAVSSHLNTVRPEFYDPERPPAASKAMVIGTGSLGRTLTLDMIAVPK
ncbi:MAG: Rid family hydrolase [Planctomycetaceae bacterium]|nr:Rid family hydrolase [Planctomycetaceae bacterium]